MEDDFTMLQTGIDVETTLDGLEAQLPLICSQMCYLTYLRIFSNHILGDDQRLSGSDLRSFVGRRRELLIL